mmetsp:Transcript_31724/g.48629  ORF Transcript_31724/g.48629 Transcript_31724/m.48629 type:complete len:102 (-) Transcript_31724:628-933(-)
MVGMAGCLMLMGPSQLLQFPDSYWLIVAGFPLLGIFQTFVFIPIIPEMIERLQVSLEITEGEEEAVDNRLNDKINDAYGLIYALSNFVSPYVGSLLYSAYG